MTDPKLKTFTHFIVDYWKIYSETRHKSCEIFKVYNNITRDEPEYFIADVIQIRLYDFYGYGSEILGEAFDGSYSSNVCV